MDRSSFSSCILIALHCVRIVLRLVLRKLVVDWNRNYQGSISRTIATVSGPPSAFVPSCVSRLVLESLLHLRTISIRTDRQAEKPKFWFLRDTKYPKHGQQPWLPPRSSNGSRPSLSCCFFANNVFLYFFISINFISYSSYIFIILNYRVMFVIRSFFLIYEWINLKNKNIILCYKGGSKRFLPRVISAVNHTLNFHTKFVCWIILIRNSNFQTVGSIGTTRFKRHGIDSNRYVCKVRNSRRSVLLFLEGLHCRVLRVTKLGYRFTKTNLCGGIRRVETWIFEYVRERRWGTRGW